MKLATTTGDLYGYTANIDETLSALSSVGFKYADYNFCSDFRDGTGFYSKDEHYLNTVIESAKRHGITFVQAHSPMGNVIGRDESQKAFVEATKHSVRISAKLGIPNIVVHSGYAMNISKEECFERNREFFVQILETADECGVNVLVENFNKMCIENLYWIDNVYEQREFIEYVSHPFFHGCLDFGHNNMQTTTPYEACVALGEHLYAIHVQDNLENDDHHMAPLFGTLNLDSLMCGLKEVGYNGVFAFESDKIMRPAYMRKKSDRENRLANIPLDIRLKAESLLYDIGKWALETYDCFEQ